MFDEVIEPSLFGRSLMRAATASAALDLLGTYGPIFRPSAQSTAGPSATAAQNTTAIQAAIAACVAAGGGTVALETPGVWSFNAQGANPYQPGTLYGFEITGNDVQFYVGPGVTLKLANNQQTGATDYFFMFEFQNKNRIRFYGGGTLDCNSQGQSGYSGGYSQQRGGHINGRATSAGGGLNDITIEDLSLVNTFGNPINLGNLGGSNEAISTRCYARNNRCRVFGEGIQFIGINDLEYHGNTVDDSGATSQGDWLELSNCLNGSVTNNHVIGTGSNASAGSGLDLYGSKRITVTGNVFDGPNGVIDMGDGPGTSQVDDITVSGNVFRNADAGVSAPPSGRANFSNNVWDAVADGGACIQALNSTTGSTMMFNNEFFLNCGQHIFSRGSCLFNHCTISGGSGVAIFFNQVAGHTPTFTWHGGRITGRTSGGAAIGIQSIASTDFAPSVQFSNVDLSGNAGGVLSAPTNTGSYRNFIFDNPIQNTTTDANRPSQSLGTVAVNGTLESATTLMTTGRNKSLATSRVMARVTALTGTPSVTLSVGSVAGSYVDVCPSQVLSPTAVGQVIALTLATGAGPAANSAVLVNVTVAAATACKFQFTIEGEEQPEYYAAPAPTTTNVTSLVLFLPRESTYWQDTGATTPAVIGDRVARWDTGMAGLPRAQQGTAGARPVRQSIGLTNFDNTSIMSLVDSGGSATSVSLTGDFTAYFTGYLSANNNGWYPVTNSAGTGGFLIAQGAGNIIFQTDAAQISVTFATLGVTASGSFLFRFRRSSGVVTLSLTGRSTDYNLGTLAGTVTLNRIQNWVSSMSSNTTHRNGNIVVCNAALTHDGTEDTLIRNYLYESSAVRLY